MLLRSCPRRKESGSKAIAEKREGKNQWTIFSFREAEGIGVTGGRRKEEAKERRKAETAAGKSLIGSAQSSSLAS